MSTCTTMHLVLILPIPRREVMISLYRASQRKSREHLQIDRRSAIYIEYDTSYGVQMAAFTRHDGTRQQLNIRDRTFSNPVSGGTKLF